MGKKTINQALKDLFLGLGGNPSALSDNTSVSDYIEDLEGAIKGETSSIIDDNTASESKVYSSSKVESLIPTDELPSVTSEDIGNILTVVSDGESGATWDKAPAPSGGGYIIYDGTVSSSTFTLSNSKKVADVVADLSANKIVYLRTNTGYVYSLCRYDSGYVGFMSLYRESTTWQLLSLSAETSSTGSTFSFMTKVIT